MSCIQELLLLLLVFGQGHGQVQDRAVNDLLEGYITPRSGYFDISEECKKAGDDYLEGLKNVIDGIELKPQDARSSSLAKLDASAFFPPSGVLSDGNVIHFPGSFTGCLNVKDTGYKAEGPNQGLDGKYCLLTLVNYDTYISLSQKKTSKDMLKELYQDKPNLPKIIQNEYYLPDQDLLGALTHSINGEDETCPPKKTFALNGIYKIGKCIPKACSDTDVAIGGFNYLYNLHNQSTILNYTDFKDFLYVIPFSCHTKDETIDMTGGDITMIIVLSLFALLISLSTFLDVGITVFDLPYLPKKFLPILQGFSAYHNIMKIFNVTAGPSDGSNLACINGLKYISITWVILGHIYWEYTNVSGYSALTSSVTALSKAAANSAGFTAVWNGLFAVDTFLIVGGCLVAFHTLKEMDKVEGGSLGLWAMFYIHRYMAIDMQYFILTPILLTILWKKPMAGYITAVVLLAAGVACQIAFTVKDDEFFHGGFSYYVKPWNRSHPYIIGVILGHTLHNMRSKPTLNINILLNFFIWGIMTAMACAVVYGVSNWNPIVDIQYALPCPPCDAPCDKPSMASRAIFNGFEKIAWSLPVCWVILACVKGRGGVVNSILSWSAWVPLARVQYCVYLLHRSIIYIINSQTEEAVRYTNTLLTIHNIAIIGITTFSAFVFVILFEAPIVQMEKLLFGSLGMGKMPQKRKE